MAAKLTYLPIKKSISEQSRLTTPVLKVHKLTTPAYLILMLHLDVGYRLSKVINRDSIVFRVTENCATSSGVPQG